MRAVIQRVRRVSVSVAGKEISRIEAGFLVLVAVKVGDGEEQAHKLAEKISKLRIIVDEEEKMNLSLLDKKESVMLVSQFTLYGDTSRGNRPSFIDSARPGQARPLFEILAADLRALGLSVALGAFGEHMAIELINDGPTTIILDV
ncbi:MAG: D-aminoacyl-tRNA deacylase [Patescibacteria group bacterium]|nr:D-aminoacyl-tRNA deacylase [Patescibacteria group bacterium]